MERFYLSVEQSVLFDARVAVHGPHQAERVAPAAAAVFGVRVLVRLRAEHGGRRPPMNLDVSPDKSSGRLSISFDPDRMGQNWPMA